MSDIFGCGRGSPADDIIYREVKIYTREVFMLSGMTLNNGVIFSAGNIRSAGRMLGSALKKIASGKEINSPKDNIPDYFRSQKINQDNKGYEQVIKNLNEANAVLTTAEKAGMVVFDRLSEMKELVRLYWDGNTPEDAKKGYEADFNALASEVESIIQDATYDGKNLIADTSGSGPLKSVSLDPNNINQTLDINFDASHVPDTALLNITGPDSETVMSEVENELSKAGRYLGKVSGYLQGVFSHYRLAQNTIRNYEELDRSIKSANEAEEMSKAVEWNIRYQASMSMFTQANMSRAGILSLFE